MNLKGIMLNDKSQPQEVTHARIHLYTSAKGQNYRDGNRSMVVRS